MIVTNYPDRDPLEGKPVPQLQSRTQQRLGWLPEFADQRDKMFTDAAVVRARGGAAALLSARRYPSHVDLRPDMPPVYDQSALGSCTANAIAGAYEYQQKKQGLTDYTPSRLFIYYGERVLLGTVGVDSGAFIRDGLKVVNKLGAPHESLWPYEIDQFTREPNADSYADGLLHQATEYRSVRVSAPEVKLALSIAHPVVIGFTVYQSFWNIGSDGYMPEPKPIEGVDGGHAVLVCGYFNGRAPGQKSHRDWFICRNSWGSSWGAEGYFYMPASWMCSNWNADDFWTITQAES